MLPINFDFLFLHLHNYEGIYFFIAILSSIIYFTYLCKENNIDIDKMYEATFISLLVALVAGRLFSFLLWSPQELFSNPIVFFQPWNGGITVAGAVLGGLVTGVIYAKVNKLSFFYHIQYYIPPIVLGQIIGRFGCFLNGDASGKPTDIFWGVVFAPESSAYSNRTTYFTPSLPPVGTSLHPTQLYEIFGNLIFLLIILLTEKNQWITKRRVIWYALWYSTLRFIIEFFRTDNIEWAFLRSGQIICLIGFVIGISLLIWSIFNDSKLDAKEENIARAKI
ncbi:MAG: prolipoprotein diacylglyceryl transferase [Spirochaetes bacterium GWD1_27_9]|nr:MAG: prolipoprotein diacylglyceryl transferase [Spirochaetes bacterium GWC1_27_15]OHD31533.1 MAG: prolipoprotein diacylglyceryl transferase [Spirochaetes bacterium GWD1_27_9]